MNNGNEFYGVDKVNCLECGNTYTEKSGNLVIDDQYVGKIIMSGIPYYHCDNCGDMLYSEQMAEAIESERNNRIQEILIRFPISNYISASDTSSILGISRQALHKNRRISHGFIYQTKFAGLTVYLKRSVLQYYRTGDGRFPLGTQKHSFREEYVKNVISTGTLSFYESNLAPTKAKIPFTKVRHIHHKERIYAN